MKGLGRIFDIGTAFAPVDSQSGAITGKRIAVRGARGLSIVLFKGAGTGTDHPVVTINQHTAYTGGTTAAATDAVSEYFHKSEAVLDNDEAWVRVTSGISAGVITTALATSQSIIIIPVYLANLTDTYTHVSADVADTGSAGAQLMGGLYILHELAVRRAPANLGNLLRPGVANA
jgi:hypothetical protein